MAMEIFLTRSNIRMFRDIIISCNNNSSNSKQSRRKMFNPILCLFQCLFQADLVGFLPWGVVSMDGTTMPSAAILISLLSPDLICVMTMIIEGGHVPDCHPTKKTMKILKQWQETYKRDMECSGWQIMMKKLQM